MGYFYGVLYVLGLAGAGYVGYAYGRKIEAAAQQLKTGVKKVL